MSDIERARDLIEKGQREKAVALLERTLAEDIDQIEAWRLMAKTVDDVTEITECYEHVLRLDPHDAEAIANLSNLTFQNNVSNVLPFFNEDYSTLSEGWEMSGEPPEHPGVDTAPMKLEPEASAVSSGSRLPPVQPLKPEELLLLEDEGGAAAAAKEEKPGLLENDAFFYTMIVVIILAVLAVLFFLLRNELPAWLSGLLPF